MREERKLPGGTWNRRDTEYTPRGYIDRVSTTWTGVPSSWTEYDDYDQFGRPGTITAPDGSQVSLDYHGVREVSRTVTIGTASGETPHTTVEEYDRQGRLFRVTEPPLVNPAGEVFEAASTVSTYGYDPAGRLASVAMVSGIDTQNRNFVYDGRGFLTSESHPEKSMPVLHQDYDARGNSRRKIDGASDLSIAFDRAERVETVFETSGNLLKQFEYASANEGSNLLRGKLKKAWRHNYLSGLSGTPDVTVREEYAYEGVGGRPTRRTTFVDTSEVFRVSAEYHPLGLPAKVCHGAECGAATIEIQYQYDQGLLAKVTGYADPIGYHPNLMLSSMTHANGVIDVWDADPDEMRRPGRIQTTNLASGAPFDTGTFAFDGAGNITAMGSDTFLYDPLSRLSSATVQGFVEENIYDAFGNRTAAKTLGLFRTSPTDPATNRLLGTANRPIDYDTAGNLTTWGTASYTYDPLHMLTRLEDSDSGEDESYVYTADDERVAILETSGGTQTSGRWMLRDFNNQLIRSYTQGAFGGALTPENDYIRRGTQLLAKETPTGTFHAHLDHLGTPRLWTDSAGAFSSRHDYLPFGEEILPGMHTETLRFTGHERDEHQSGGCSGTTTVDNQTLTNGEDFVGCDLLTSSNTTVAGTEEVRFTSGMKIGLGEDFTVAQQAHFVAEMDGNLKLDRQDWDYMHARYCSPWLGRFGSVDPLNSGTLADPQTWNRYSYVDNNPLSFVDPNGRSEKPVHVVHTKRVLRGQGFRSAAIRAISLANVRTDTNLIHRMTPRLHATSVFESDPVANRRGIRKAGKLLDKAIRQANKGRSRRAARTLGMALHTREDAVAHAPVGNLTLTVLEEVFGSGERWATHDARDLSVLFKPASGDPLAAEFDQVVDEQQAVHEEIERALQEMVDRFLSQINEEAERYFRDVQ